MQPYATPVYNKSKTNFTSNKVKSTTFFSPVKVQPKLTIGTVDDPYEREADAMADRVIRMPANTPHQETFFKPTPSIIQRQDDATKTLTEGAGVVKDQLDDKPGFEEWKDAQTDALKKKVWDDQPTELKAGIIGFGLSSLGVLGTVFGTNPGFRADTIKLLNDKNIALPLSLIPYHDYFPLSSFKYKLPSDQGSTTEFSTEFEFKPYLDMMHQKWSFIPKTDITLGVDTAYSKSGGFGFSGGSIKVKFGGGIINLQGFLNQTLPATPMLVSGNNPGESPMWIMRTLPGQFDDQLPKGSGVFVSVDVLRLPELWKGDDKKTDVQRKCAKCEDEEKLQRKESNTTESLDTSPIEHTLQSSGAPLERNTRSFMEERFGYDFSNVKIHTDTVAAKSAGSINALAYTSGNNIVFNQNQFSPETNSGKKLLAHELTHVLQQGNKIRRTPKDQHGRPLGFVDTPEQEAYDKETDEINKWKKVLDRIDNGEIDDTDFADARIRNRLTGLTSPEVRSLITRIKDNQAKNPALKIDHLTEWLEVRQEISTPMPDGATVNKDPLLNTIDSYSLNIGKVKVIVATDTFGNAQNDTGPASNFGRNYRWTANNKNIINGLFNTESGSDVAVNPTSFEITIRTMYNGNPDLASGYGKGTTQDDQRDRTTTLRVHEGKHGTDYLDYIRSTAFPVDISKGIVGVLTVEEMKKIDKYISGITAASCEATDQVGYTQDEFLRTPQGKVSGIKSCRK